MYFFQVPTFEICKTLHHTHLGGIFEKRCKSPLVYALQMYLFPELKRKVLQTYTTYVYVSRGGLKVREEGVAYGFDYMGGMLGDA